MTSLSPPPDRISTAPLSVELSGSHRTGRAPSGWVNAIPRQWLGASGYLIAGVVLGLVLIAGLSLSRSSTDPEPAAGGGVITDNVQRLGASNLGEACWSEVSKDGPARLTVSIEVGVDGKVRSAVATGESRAMRSCVEAHVRGWDFLPQAAAQALVLPFEVERR